MKVALYKTTQIARDKVADDCTIYYGAIMFSF